jgi:uncharacterized protein (TIGR00297 family)
MPVALHRGAVLRWQSRLLLAVVVTAVSGSVLMQATLISRFAPKIALAGAAIGLVFGMMVWLLRAAMPGAAFTGALFTISLYFVAPGWRSLLWPLLALLVLTFAATRFGRARKEELQIAEERRGRSASQVAANLGAAALISIVVSVSHFFALSPRILGHPMLIALMAALAETTADTLSSGFGEVLGGEPVLVTTLRRVPAGTDGAVSIAGTSAGCIGAAVIALLAAVVLPLSWAEGLVVVAAGIIGLFFDSLLGATLERRGLLNNDAVNFLSTCAAALCAVLISAAQG